MNKKVERFADQMEIELENNVDKGSVFLWKGIEEKLVDLEYHKSKLYIAIKEKNNVAIKEYIADIANILLSIGDEYKLYELPSKNMGQASQMVMPCIKIIPNFESARRKLIKK